MLSIPHTLQQNVVVEGRDRTFPDVLRLMIV